MESDGAIEALSALAQPTRLLAFRLLVGREPEGMAAGELARRLGVPQNTLSSHLSIMARAGLVRGERHSRSIHYRADLNGLRALVTFLLEDCCGGRPDLCAPLLADVVACHAQSAARSRPETA
jgi:DNA-binding transcriptional ArsR family regulator